MSREAGASPLIGTHESVIETGLTKRELFAAMAMQGLLLSGISNAKLARFSVEQADALIAELAKEQRP